MSWSLVCLVVTLTAALVLGLSLWLPARVKDDIGVTQLEPGLLTVRPAAQGQITLGRGYTVALYSSGLRISSNGSVMLDTAYRGSFLSALTGRVRDGDETVTSTLRNVRVDALSFGDGHAVWTGLAYGSGGPDAEHRPVRVDVTRSGRVVRVAVEVTGADGVALHVDPRPATIGQTPALPARNLRHRAWWAGPQGQSLYTNVLGVSVGLDADGSARAVDLRPDGVLALHAWTQAPVLTVTTLPDFAMGDS